MPAKNDRAFRVNSLKLVQKLGLRRPKFRDFKYDEFQKFKANHKNSQLTNNQLHEKYVLHKLYPFNNLNPMWFGNGPAPPRALKMNLFKFKYTATPKQMLNRLLNIKKYIDTSKSSIVLYHIYTDPMYYDLNAALNQRRLSESNYYYGLQRRIKNLKAKLS
jgi:hypothetical protein